MSSVNYRVATAVQLTEPPPSVPSLLYPYLAFIPDWAECCETIRVPKVQGWGDEYASSSRSDQSPLLNLAQGVPRDAPHPLVLEHLSQTSSDPTNARYGPILGEPSLRSGYAREIRHQYQLQGDESSVTAEDVAITTGCNMAFLTLLMVLCPPGSSVLLPMPSYFSHTMSLSIQSLKPVYIPSDPSEDFKPSLSSARSYLENHTKEEDPRMIALVSPNNPTGAVYPPDELRKWYNLARELKVALVIDEPYRHFVTNDDGNAGRKPHRLFEEHDWRETLISIGSFSSTFLRLCFHSVLTYCRGISDTRTPVGVCHRFPSSHEIDRDCLWLYAGDWFSVQNRFEYIVNTER